MNRLVTSAVELQRKVYASLPWGFRLANFLTRLADYGTKAFGQVFLKSLQTMGVAVPPTERPEAVGSMFYKSLLSKFKNPDLVEEIMQDSIANLLDKNHRLNKMMQDKPYTECRAILMTAMKNLGIDVLRRRKKEEFSIDDPEGDRVVEDPGSWDELGEYIPERTLLEIEKDLAKTVNPKMLPDLPLYFKLLVDGYADSEILKGKMLPFLKDWGEYNHAQYANWQKTYKDKIKTVLKKHLDSN